MLPVENSHLGQEHSPAIRINGVSDSSPRKASCSRVMLTCSIAASWTPLRASYNSLNRGGTVFPAVMTDEFVNGRKGIVGDEVTGRVGWRTRAVFSILVPLAPVRVESARLHAAQDGQ